MSDTMNDGALTDQASRTILPSSGAPAYPPVRYAWYICILLFLAYVLSFIDRGILGILVVQVEQDFHLDDLQLSLVQGFSFALFYAVLGLPIAYLIDTGSRRVVIGLGILTWSLMTGLCGLSQTYWQLFLCRVGVGAGEATLLPGATSLLKDCFPRRKRGVPLGVFAAGIFIGSSLSALGAAAILKHLGGHSVTVPALGTLHPWRIVMLAAGIVGLPVALLIGLIREPARRERSTAQDDRAVAPMVRLYRAHGRALWLHHLGFTFVCFASYAFLAWLPAIFIRDYGWTAPQIGTALGLLLLTTGPAGSLVGGMLADRYARQGAPDGKPKVGMIAALGIVVPSILFTHLASPLWSLGLVAIMAFFSSFIWGLAPGSLQEIVPEGMLGRVTAFYTAIVNLISIGLGPTSTALVARLFAGPLALGEAASIVVPAAALIAAAAFQLGRTPYVRAAQLRVTPVS